jgi:propane monooxygenase reductase subunit
VTARVLFEPIGEEIECGDDESVLDAAFRQGYSLVHGCREGQCSACKAYLLEGDVTLKPYSTFALSETEETQGYTLLCRAMPDDDLVVELLHFDPDDYKLAHPIRDGRATVAAVEDLTHDIVRVDLEVREPADFDFTAGQYVDVWVPDSEDRRSFSMANLPGDGRLELIIKRYPGGRFSGLLADGAVAAGDELGFTGPYGALRLRPTERDVLMVAGGSGMAPILGLLRRLAAEGSDRSVRFFYGARTRADLFLVDEIDALGARLADFAFTPVLSEEDWDGETGLVHEAVGRHLAGGGSEDCEAYLCGPGPMVDAATELLVDAHGIDESDVHFDKFTIAGGGD